MAGSPGWVYPKHPTRERHKKARQPLKNLARLGSQATIKIHFKLRIMKRKVLFTVLIIVAFFASLSLRINSSNGEHSPRFNIELKRAKAFKTKDPVCCPQSSTSSCTIDGQTFKGYYPIYV
jgi:hypothetical protein